MSLVLFCRTLGLMALICGTVGLIIGLMTGLKEYCSAPEIFLGHEPLFSLCRSRFKKEPGLWCVSLGGWRWWLSVWYYTVLHKHTVRINDVFLAQRCTDWPGLFKPSVKWVTELLEDLMCPFTLRHDWRFFCSVAKYACVKTPVFCKIDGAKINGPDEKNNFIAISLSFLIHCFDQDWQPFSVKNQIVNMLGFAAYISFQLSAYIIYQLQLLRFAVLEWKQP